jgi:hypothetical protein
VTLLELIYQRCKAQRAARELLDKSVHESRALTVAEQVRFDGLLTRIHEIDSALEARAQLRKV